MHGIKIPLKEDGTLKSPIRTFFRLMLSDDNYMPSSARVLGTSIFAFILCAIGSMTGVVLWKLVVATDPTVIATLVGALKTLVWIYLFLIASGLSFYGIHVWKYIAQIQGGLLNSPSTPYTPPYSQSFTPRPQLVTPEPDNPIDKDLPDPPASPKKTQIAGVGSDD